MKRAFSAERALVSTQLARDIREAIRSGQKLDVPTTATQGAPAVAAVSGASEAADSTTPRDSQRRNIFEKVSLPACCDCLHLACTSTPDLDLYSDIVLSIRGFWQLSCGIGLSAFITTAFCDHLADAGSAI